MKDTAVIKPEAFVEVSALLRGKGFKELEVYPILGLTGGRVILINRGNGELVELYPKYLKMVDY